MRSVARGFGQFFRTVVVIAAVWVVASSAGGVVWGTIEGLAPSMGSFVAPAAGIIAGIAAGVLLWRWVKRCGWI